MSVPQPPAPCLLVFGVLLSGGLGEDPVAAKVAESFGEIGEVKEFAPFGHTGYYEREMGEGIRRGFFVMKELVDPGTLADVKLRSNALETELSGGTRRRANLDPGLLNLTQFVLATGKPAGHRIYLGKGIWAEIEYLFQFGEFKFLDWTYPDYREPGIVEFFNTLRAGYKIRQREKR
ncbi:DUF4416 family protein [bacterium]|nr:MAG: DUF4416 family protein [bacterium]